MNLRAGETPGGRPEFSMIAPVNQTRGESSYVQSELKKGELCHIQNHLQKKRAIILGDGILQERKEICKQNLASSLPQMHSFRNRCAPHMPSTVVGARDKAAGDIPISIRLMCR